jgi:ribose transport system ATP-binding protein
VNSLEHLAVENLHKRLGAINALNGVSLKVRSATVHGLIGHNGSGKSTTVKILAGVLQPDKGLFRVVCGGDGPQPRYRKPNVVSVFQDLGLADNLTAFENVLVNSFEKKPFGMVKVRRERARARELFAVLGLDVPLELEAWRLPEPERVMLCVARALLHAGVQIEDGVIDADAGLRVDLLVLDEPTSSLPREDLGRFRALVRTLTEEAGVATLLVTHNPADIETICDDFTALRNGEVMRSAPAQGYSTGLLAELMAGKSIEPDRDDSGGPDRGVSSAAARRPGQPLFVAQDLVIPGLDGPVSLAAHPGELLGITGLEGSGFRAFVEAAMGVRERLSGTVSVGGQKLSSGPAGVRRANAVYIPSDRARTSGVPSAMVYENMTLGRIDVFCHRGIVQRNAEKAAVRRMLEKLNVDPPDPARTLSELSGGQQQKVVIGRALLSDAKLFVFEEPTAAVDVGASRDILSYLRESTREGVCVMAASAEFEWMPTVCDRVIVFRSGKIAGELMQGEITEERILSLAYG